jgi:tetratricopeptide (TPR) repeat protein/membrane protease YdiL (CAAX protease family)
VKKCPYCGTEYPDDATVCIIDTTELIEHPPKQKPVKEKSPAEALTARSATIIFLVCFITQIFVAALLYAIDGERLGPLADFLYPVVGFMIMVPMAFRLMPKDIKKTDSTSLAWTLGKWENLVSGLSIGCIIGVGSYFWDLMSPSHSFSPSLQRQPVEPVYQMAFTPGSQQILAFVLLVLLGPAFEEMMFRGILYGGYRKSFGPLWAALITTGIFVAIHFPNYIYVPYKIVPYIVVSLALLWCRLHWKAIGPAIAAHGGFNLVAVVIPSLIWSWQHAFYESGVADYQALNFNQAIANLTHAIHLGDKSPHVYIYRGNAKLEEGDVDGAISDYSKAVELNPKDSTAFYDRGLAKDRNADFEGVIADYDEAIALNRRNIKAYDNRGLAQIKEGKLEAAMADFDMAIELNPTNSISYNNRGWAEFLEGDFDSSITDATRSIQLDPNVGYAYGTRGWARYAQGDISGATEDCKKAIELFQQGSAPDFYDQGLLDFIAGNYEKAISVWQKAIQKDITLKSELQPWIEKAQAKLQEKNL